LHLQIKAAIGEWGAGTYAASKAKYYHEGATIDAGPGKVPGWGKYTYATIDQWCVDRDAGLPLCRLVCTVAPLRLRRAPQSLRAAGVVVPAG